MSIKEGPWSVVGKTNKKKGQTEANSKAQKKAWIDNMPRLQLNDPLEQTPTMFDAFIKREEVEFKPPIPAASKIPVSSDVKKAHTEKKKKPDVHKKKPKMTFEEAVRKIHVADLENTLQQCRLMFANNPSVWLKEIASYINVVMDTVPDPDPVYKDKPKDFPLCALNRECRTFLPELLASTSPDTVNYMFYYCIQIILAEVSKGHSTYGYRMFLQSIVSYKPDVLSGKTEQYLELLKTNHNRPANCLSLLWSVGQCGIGSTKTGLKVWLELMLPIINLKAVAPYIISYLEYILRGDISEAYGAMTIRDFFPLLDLIFSNTLSIQSELKVRLAAAYPKLKQISIKDQPDKTLHLFFPSFLTRATTDCTGAMRAEVLSSLLACLLQDKQSFSIWRQMYTKHLSQSAILLNYMGDNWSKVTQKIEKKQLFASLQSFSITNKELAQRGHNDPERSGCTQICADLLQRMAKPKFSKFRILFWISLFLAGVIVYDLYSAKTFRTSRTLGFMEHYGILAAANQLWSLVKHHTTVAANWLKVNVPAYSMLAYSTAAPYVTVAAQKVSEGWAYVMEVTRPHRTWLLHNTVDLILKIYNWAPIFWDDVSSYASWSKDAMYDNLVVLKQATLRTSNVCAVWFTENVFTGQLSAASLGEILSGVVTTVHSQVIHTYRWCSSLVTSWL